MRSTRSPSYATDVGMVDLSKKTPPRVPHPLTPSGSQKASIHTKPMPCLIVHKDCSLQKQTSIVDGKGPDHRLTLSRP